MTKRTIQYACAAITIGLVSAVAAPFPISAKFGALEQKQTEATAPIESSVESNSAANAASPPPATSETPSTETPAAPAPQVESKSRGCTRYSEQEADETGFKKKGRFGKIGAFFGRLTRKIPIIGNAMVDASMRLTDAVACRLNPQEQEQAADATEQVTQNGEVGQTVSWKSTTRENVSGSSTIESKDKTQGGTVCMTIADVVIVDGEELKISKKMCRAPGAARFSIVTS